MPVIFYFFLTPCLVKPVSTARENKEGGNLIDSMENMYVHQSKCLGSCGRISA